MAGNPREKMLRLLQRWKEVSEDHSREQRKLINELKESLKKKPECSRRTKKRKTAREQTVWHDVVEAGWTLEFLEEREEELQEDLEELWDEIRETIYRLYHGQAAVQVEESAESNVE